MDGALAASVFHSGAIAIPDLKRYLRDATHRGETVIPDDVGRPRLGQGWRAAAGHRAARAHRARADAGLHERGRAARDAGPRSRGLLQPLAPGASGPRARPPATSSTSWTSAPTATRTRCWCSRTRSGPPATRARNPASPTRRPPTRSASPSSALLENIIANRIADQPEGSYTARLFAEGPGRIAQKVGEEGVETALAAVSRDDDGLVSECADLLFHLLLLLKSRDLSLERVVDELRARHASKG